MTRSTVNDGDGISKTHFGWRDCQRWRLLTQNRSLVTRATGSKSSGTHTTSTMQVSEPNTTSKQERTAEPPTMLVNSRRSTDGDACSGDTRVRRAARRLRGLCDLDSAADRASTRAAATRATSRVQRTARTTSSARAAETGDLGVQRTARTTRAAVTRDRAVQEIARPREREAVPTCDIRTDATPARSSSSVAETAQRKRAALQTYVISGAHR